MSKRILLVDPNFVIADSLTPTLLGVDILMTRVPTPEAAGARARLIEPAALIVCDRPDLDALGVCDAIRSVRWLDGLPILAVTVASRDKIRNHQLTARAARRYLPPNGDVSQLVQAIQELLAPRERPMPPSVPRTAPGGSLASARGGVVGVRGATIGAVAMAPRIAAEEQPIRVESAVIPVPPRGSLSPAEGTLRPSASTLAMEAVRREGNELRRRAEDLERKWNDAEARVRTLTEALTTAGEERETADAAWKAWVTSAEEYAGQAWAERGRLVAERQQLMQRLSDAEERIRLVTHRSTEREAQINALRKELDEVRATLARAERLHQESIRKVAAEQARVDAAAAELVTAQAQAHDLEARRLDLEAENTSLRRDLAAARAEVEATRRESEFLARELEQATSATQTPRGGAR